MTSQSDTENFQRFGLAEIMAVLAPGATFLFSLLLWIPADIWKLLLARPQGPDSVLVTTAFILAAYVAGLIMNVWATQGWLWHVDSSALLPMRSTWSKPYFGLLVLCSWFLFGWRNNLQRGADIENRVEMYLYIRKKCGEGVSQKMRLFDFFQFYRTVAWYDVAEKQSRMLLEADLLFRRRLFCHGVSLPLLLAGVQSGLRFWTLRPHNLGLWSGRHWALSALCIGPILASFLLRVIAFRLLRDEAIYTYAIHTSYKNDASH